MKWRDQVDLIKVGVATFIGTIAGLGIALYNKHDLGETAGCTLLGFTLGFLFGLYTLMVDGKGEDNGDSG